MHVYFHTFPTTFIIQKKKIFELNFLWFSLHFYCTFMFLALAACNQSNCLIVYSLFFLDFFIYSHLFTFFFSRIFTESCRTCWTQTKALQLTKLPDSTCTPNSPSISHQAFLIFWQDLFTDSQAHCPLIPLEFLPAQLCSALFLPLELNLVVVFCWFYFEITTILTVHHNHKSKFSHIKKKIAS